MAQETKQERIARLRKEREEAARANQDEIKNVAKNLNIETDMNDAMDELINEVEKEAAVQQLNDEKDTKDNIDDNTTAQNNNQIDEKTEIHEPKYNSQNQPIESPIVKAGEIVKIKFLGNAKNETKSKRKQLLVRPSVHDRIEEILNSQFPGVSFNDLANQLLEGWLDEIGAQDTE